MFYSPQVTLYCTSNWKGSSGEFCNPGSIKLSCTWGELADDPTRAVDLEELTGKATWTEDEIYEYGLKCIAHSCLSELLRCSTSGWVAADWVGGEMQKVHKYMGAYEHDLVVHEPPLFVHRVTSGYTGDDCRHRVGQTRITTHLDGNTEYHNRNSGNDVLWLTGTLDQYDGGFVPDNYCDEHGAYECEYAECTGVAEPCLVMGTQIRQTYNNPLFMQQVRRYVWSNG